VRIADLKGHLLSDDFFAADKHPEIAFRSTAVRTAGEDVEVEGELTIKGITNHVVAKGTLTGPVTGIAGAPVLGLALETVVDRTQYGLTWNADLPSGGKVLGNDVKIVVEAELVKAEA
jgi:polyisoprenoid-binding protein YceI